jgi:hypothetical protein
MKIYAFDIDETLEISGGPVTIQMMVELRQQGHIVGLCGNWALFCQRLPHWHQLVSFMGVGVDKITFLAQLKTYVPAEEYIMVGNILGVSGASDDKGSADKAGWRFIQESKFAAGER